MKDAGGRVIGVVTLRIRASSVAGILEEARGISERNAMLIDGDGVLLHHSDPWLVFKSLAPLPADTLKAIVADQRFRRDTIESVGLPGLAQKMVGATLQGNADFVTPLTGAPVEGHDDHRLAMAMTIAGLAAVKPTVVYGSHVTADSFPGFEMTLQALGARLSVEG